MNLKQRLCGHSGRWFRSCKRCNCTAWERIKYEWYCFDKGWIGMFAIAALGVLWCAVHIMIMCIENRPNSIC